VAHAGAHSTLRANVFLTALTAMMPGPSSYRALLVPAPWATLFRSQAAPASLRHDAPSRVRSRSPAGATVLHVSPREYGASPLARIPQLECWAIFLLSHPHELVQQLLPLACPCSLIANRSARFGRSQAKMAVRAHDLPGLSVIRRLHLIAGPRNASFSVISGANGCTGRIYRTDVQDVLETCSDQRLPLPNCNPMAISTLQKPSIAPWPIAP